MHSYRQLPVVCQPAGVYTEVQCKPVLEHLLMTFITRNSSGGKVAYFPQTRRHAATARTKARMRNITGGNLVLNPSQLRLWLINLSPSPLIRTAS